MNRKQKEEFDKTQGRGSSSEGRIPLPYKSAKALDIMRTLAVLHNEFFERRAHVPTGLVNPTVCNNGATGMNKAKMSVPGPFTSCAYNHDHFFGNPLKKLSEQEEPIIPKGKLKSKPLKKKAEVCKGCCPSSCPHYEDVGMYYTQYLKEVTLARLLKKERPAFSMANISGSTLKLVSNIQESLSDEVRDQIENLFAKDSFARSILEIRSLAQLRSRTTVEPQKEERMSHWTHPPEFLQRKQMTAIVKKVSTAPANDAKRQYLSKVTKVEEDFSDQPELKFKNPYPMPPMDDTPYTIPPIEHFQYLSPEMRKFKLAQSKMQFYRDFYPNATKEELPTKFQFAPELVPKKKLFRKKQKPKSVLPFIQVSAKNQASDHKCLELPPRTGSGFTMSKKPPQRSPSSARVVNFHPQKSDSSPAVVNLTGKRDSAHNKSFINAEGKFDLKLYQQSIISYVEGSGHLDNTESADSCSSDEKSTRKTQPKKTGKRSFNAKRGNSSASINRSSIPTSQDLFYGRELAAGDLKNEKTSDTRKKQNNRVLVEIETHKPEENTHSSSFSSDDDDLRQ